MPSNDKQQKSREKHLKAQNAKLKSVLSNARSTLQKGKTINFGFALGSGDDSHFLMMSLTKKFKPSDVLKEAKKCIDEKLLMNKACVGSCDLNQLKGINFNVLQGQKAPEMAKKIRASAKAHLGLTLSQLTVDNESDEESEDVPVEKETEEVSLKAPTSREDGAQVQGQKVKSIRLDAIRNVAELVSALRETDDDRAPEIADILVTLAKDMPNALEQSLQDLGSAIKTGKSGSQVDGLRQQVRNAATEWANFLAKNSSVVEGCEKNPWNISIQIRQPVTDTVKWAMQFASNSG